jgi:hypothetical protein
MESIYYSGEEDTFTEIFAMLFFHAWTVTTT